MRRVGLAIVGVAAAVLLAEVGVRLVLPQPPSVLGLYTRHPPADAVRAAARSSTA